MTLCTLGARCSEWRSSRGAPNETQRTRAWRKCPRPGSRRWGVCASPLPPPSPFPVLTSLGCAIPGLTGAAEEGLGCASVELGACRSTCGCSPASLPPSLGAVLRLTFPAFSAPPLSQGLPRLRSALAPSEFATSQWLAGSSCRLHPGPQGLVPAKSPCVSPPWHSCLPPLPAAHASLALLALWWLCGARSGCGRGREAQIPWGFHRGVQRRLLQHRGLQRGYEAMLLGNRVHAKQASHCWLLARSRLVSCV